MFVICLAIGPVLNVRPEFLAIADEPAITLSNLAARLGHVGLEYTEKNMLQSALKSIATQIPATRPFAACQL